LICQAHLRDFFNGDRIYLFTSTVWSAAHIKLEGVADRILVKGFRWGARRAPAIGQTEKVMPKLELKSLTLLIEDKRALNLFKEAIKMRTRYNQAVLEVRDNGKVLAVFKLSGLQPREIRSSWKVEEAENVLFTFDKVEK